MPNRGYSATYRILTASIMAMLAGPAFANEDSADRIKQLEAMMQQMQQQRAEQDKQMQVMAEELKAMQQQMAQGKEADLKERGKSKGTPVLANFKDGIVFEDGSGNWQLAINGRVQADYREFDPEAHAADTFSLRRARLGGTATFYKDYVVRVEGEYSGSSTSLTYGYFDINKWKQAKIRMGQFKPFYGLERSMSTNFTDFQERSMADSLLGSTYDRGIMVHGAPVPGLYYSLAYINGTGTVDENNAREDGKDLTARVSGNIAEFAGWKDAVVHVGGWWGQGDEGSRRLASFIPTGQSEGRGASFFSTACTQTNGAGNCGAALSNGFADNVERTRGGGELALAYGPVKFQGEYIRTEFEGPSYDRDIDAWYASTVWNVTGEPFAAMYKDGIFGRLKPKNNFGANGWGAVQLGLRYSKFDASDFKTSNTNGSGVLLNNPSSTTDGLLVATNEADAWTLGANWILTPNTRLIMNYVHTEFDTPITVRVNARNDTFDSEDALTLRAQFDF
ncbi:MAG: OprO/OprP family phosphate-selective porin [Methylophilaceae bacterium]